MRATLRYLHSPDVEDLRTYAPSEPDKFGLLIQVMAGPQGGQGEESFDVFVCTPRWLEANHTPGQIVSGRHMLIVFEYDYGALKGYLEQQLTSVTGKSWREIAQQLARLGKWEFEDYLGTV